jgi:hypothetical protein
MARKCRSVPKTGSTVAERKRFIRLPYTKNFALKKEDRIIIFVFSITIQTI